MRQAKMADERQKRRFAEVVLPHLDAALSLARWLTGSLADGEDVVQEACIRAFGAIGTFRDGSPRAWVLSIVRNTAFSWLRKNRPKALVVTDDDSVFEAAGPAWLDGDTAQGPEAILIAKADAASLNAAIGALPLNFKEILVLREIDGLSYREIAEVVSLPIGTVMSRLSRARKLLMGRIGRARQDEQGVA